MHKLKGFGAGGSLRKITILCDILCVVEHSFHIAFVKRNKVHEYIHVARPVVHIQRITTWKSVRQNSVRGLVLLDWGLFSAIGL